MSRAEFQCFCGHNFQSWGERTPNFTVECRACGRLLRPRYFLDVAPHDEDRYSDHDPYSDVDDAPNFAPETARAEFDCFCGHNFEGWAERTPTFTIECRSCGRFLRPRRFHDGANNNDDRDSAEDHYSDTDAANSGDTDAAHCATDTQRAEFECFCGHNFEGWAERTPTFTLECRSCGRLLRPKRFIDVVVSNDGDHCSAEHSYSDSDAADYDVDNDAGHYGADTSRAEFECFCGHNFEGWAERTPTFTLECRACGRLLRPRRFVDEADNDENKYAGGGDVDLPRYGVAWFNCFCGHGFTSYAERAPDFYCRCHQCGRGVSPAKFLPPGERGPKGTTDSTHSCCRCEGRGGRFACPVLQNA